VLGNILGASDASRSFLLQCHATGTYDLVLTSICPCSCTLCVDRAESSPSPVLENIIQALLRDDFDLQHEAALALEQACLGADCKRMLLTVPQYAAQLVTLGRVFEHLLRAPGSGEAPISVMRVIGALTAAAAEIGHSSQAELVNLWVEVGITEALDDVQVRPFLCRSGR
jgi:hypothetical protein